MTAVEIVGLTKTYQGKSAGKSTTTQAVAGLDLRIELGEVFALLGPNGAGKSTTIEILEGYRNRDSGDVKVLGVDPQKGDAAWRARIGIVLQSTKDLTELTVVESLATFAAFYPHPRPIDEVLHLVGLGDYPNQRGSQLSGGLRRRLDVGLGILGRPELLFLDEPTTGFDPEARRHFWAMIQGLRAEGTTILLTTHYLDEAEALADRVGVINHGTLIALDTPSGLGGRGKALAKVSYRNTDGRIVEIETATPTQVVRELSSSNPGELAELKITRPSLEDTYLAMLGPDGE
ncbi:MAG: ABC transporter ATP-binding protein [Actinomycetia bacterium]|nr:ABC transporter ATP-binding protein [Actinomycetes bacterium]